jgi:3-hydroxyisobutyrate dehydrogenase-like beta-hydroxyacid dehydrogenase
MPFSLISTSSSKAFPVYCIVPAVKIRYARDMELHETSPGSATAVLGLGLIGSIWARHLHDAGALAACWNRTPRTDVPAWIGSPREAAHVARTLVIVVSDPPAVESILDAMLPALGERHLVIQSSTIGPSDSAHFHALVTASGARYLEAPFTGSQPAAEAKKTVFYLGGDEETMAIAEPTLAKISAQRIRVGTGEQACTVKLVMNLQIATQAEALCEALALARKAGIRDDAFFTCMKGNASWSGVASLKEPKLRAGDYSPQFSAKHLLKDLRLLEKEAGGLPALNMMINRLKRASESGQGNQDFTVIYRQL